MTRTKIEIRSDLQRAYFDYLNASYSDRQKLGKLIAALQAEFNALYFDDNKTIKT